MRHRLPLIALCAIAASPAAALDMPTRRAGLWELTMTFENRNMPPHTMQQCIDAATDKQMQSMGSSMGQNTCSKQDVQQVGNTIVVDSVCQMGPMTTTSHGVITGDFNSAYTMKSTSRMTGGPAVPGMPADGATNMTLDAKWLGACKADQKPGDMIMADGRKMNIRDLQNMGMPGTRAPAAPQKK